MKKDTTEERATPSDLSLLLIEPRKREAWLVERLHTLRDIESPSGDKDEVDREQNAFAEWAVAAKGKIQRHKHRNYGGSVEVRFGSRSSREKPVLLLGHLDTVWDHGTLTAMPWKATKRRSQARECWT